MWEMIGRGDLGEAEGGLEEGEPGRRDGGGGIRRRGAEEEPGALASGRRREGTRRRGFLTSRLVSSLAMELDIIILVGGFEPGSGGIAATSGDGAEETEFGTAPGSGRWGLLLRILVLLLLLVVVVDMLIGVGISSD